MLSTVIRVPVCEDVGLDGIGGGIGVGSREGMTGDGWMGMDSGAVDGSGVSGGVGELGSI